MECATSSARCTVVASIFALFALIAATILATGCGSGGSTLKMPPPPQLSGNTQVTVVLTSTANDELSQFILQIQELTLTSQSGKVVTLVSSQVPAEFIHLNGGIEPLISVSVPQDIYTSATATIGGASFTCETVMPAGSSSPGSLDTSIYAYGQTPNSQVTVNVASPITITGNSMGLVLNLQVSQSASYPSTCYPPNGGIATYSITPTFNLTPATFSPQATSPTNGKVVQMEGQIRAIAGSGTSFTLALPEPNPENLRTVSVGANSSTLFQGISDFSALTVGTMVDLDGTIQPDASLAATRIAVEDPTAVDVLTGPTLLIGGSEPGANLPSALFSNVLSLGQDPIPVTWYYGTSAAVFQISKQMNNLQALPFSASFDLSNLVAGQNVYVSSQNLNYSDGIYTSASTITLMPQTVDATVLASTASGGGFTDYTVSLAPYDLFPTLAVQPGQTTLLNNPSEMEVYIDSSTQKLNTQQPLAAGSTLRFYGLVFNDNGTLRMDCAQVNDGVPFTTQSNGADQRQTGRAQTIRREIPGGLPEIITTVSRTE